MCVFYTQPPSLSYNKLGNNIYFHTPPEVTPPRIGPILLLTWTQALPMFYLPSFLQPEESLPQNFALTDGHA